MIDANGCLDRPPVTRRGHRPILQAFHVMDLGPVSRPSCLHGLAPLDAEETKQPGLPKQTKLPSGSLGFFRRLKLAQGVYLADISVRWRTRNNRPTLHASCLTDPKKGLWERGRHQDEEH